MDVKLMLSSQQGLPIIVAIPVAVKASCSGPQVDSVLPTRMQQKKVIAKQLYAV